MKIARYLLILLLLTVIPRPSSAAGDTLRVQLKWWHQFQFAGYYAAELKGYYRQEGLNVKLIPGDPQHAPISEVLSARADFGITGSDLVIEYAKGQPVIALGAIFQHSPYTILSLKEKKINIPSDLIGKRLMASLDQGWTELQAVFLKEGINPDSLKLLSHTWKNTDLIEDKVDAITAYISVEINQLRKMGVEPSYILPINYGIDFYGDVLFTRKNMADTDPVTIGKFRKASFAGWEYAMSHTAEMADYILTLPGVKERGVTKDDLLVEAEAMRKLILPGLVEIGHMNEGRWKHILDVHQKLGVIAKQPELTGFLYDGTKKVSSKFLRNTVYVLIAVLVLLLLSVLYGFSLRKAVKKRTEELESEIGERATAQRLLSISEQRLEMATVAAGLGIWDWDIKTGQVYFNDQWKMMLGYAPAELSNDFDTFEKLLHPNEKESLMQLLQDHLDGKSSVYQAMIRMRTKDKRWKWVLTMSKASMRDDEGKAIRLSGIHLDIDDIKQKEIELKELTQELMHSNNELQQFAYITSHNLRAPVANLISLLGLFDREHLSERNTVFLEKMEISVERLHATLNDLNEILSSRINKADRDDQLVFADELNKVKELISEEIRLKEVVIQADFSKAPEIFFSRKVMHSILLNLLTNAIKYRRPGVPPLIKLYTEEDGDYIILYVKDNGLGIDMEKHGNKIFGLYQRFHDNKDGKGLGLYIIKNQVEALEGKIAVESIVNKGTMFHVFLKKKKGLYE
ncbi:ABC transporter substrate-binding protein [Sediminibacterium sp.]|uniref:ABC transporter substrate-binding protein n=1 Tax=Sediminibacterium sp. TaxID=1917865 RepID=UPI0025E52A79|nr:ABC transporter substrate-binding protein [Sediminibacterium sp.]MBW0177820.1 ABC transporter substrate-binding protein [Sediminibacterium sp.]